jgi:septum formation protein
MILSELLKDYHLVLASQSPRRKALLNGLDVSFEVIVRNDIDESYPSGLGMIEIPRFLAKKKSEYYTYLLDENTILITADTIVWHNNRVVGKPSDPDDAAAILRVLAGTMHEVITGVCLRSKGKEKIFHTCSRVFFRKMLDEEINYYVMNYKPMDKAGAYGIQEWIGYIGIEKIEGSFYNVMGLPVQTLYRELSSFILQSRASKG